MNVQKFQHELTPAEGAELRKSYDGPLPEGAKTQTTAADLARIKQDIDYLAGIVQRHAASLGVSLSVEDSAGIVKQYIPELGNPGKATKYPSPDDKKAWAIWMLANAALLVSQLQKAAEQPLGQEQLLDLARALCPDLALIANLPVKAEMNAAIALDIVVKDAARRKNIDYKAAFDLIAQSRPELIKLYQAERR